MAKTKVDKKMGQSQIGDKALEHKDKLLKVVKEGRVSKPIQVAAAQTKQVAKNIEAKMAKTGDKAKKAPKPPVQSESEDESASDGDSASGSDSESGSEAVMGANVSGLHKTNGTAKVANGGPHAEEASSGSDSDSDADGSDSDSGSDDDTVPSNVAGSIKSGVAAAANAVTGVVKDGIAAARSTVKAVSGADIDAADDNEDSEGSSDNSAESDSEAEAPTKAGKTPGAAVVNGTSRADGSEDDEDSEGSDESSSAGSENDADVEAPPAKKRKAEDVETPASKKTKTVTAGGTTTSSNLFVGSLAWTVEEDELRQVFAEFGEVTGCRIITDRTTGKSKGYGYVDFANADDAAAALEAKNGAELHGRQMNVDFSTPRSDNRTPNRAERVNDRASKFGDEKSPPSDTLFIGNISFGATADMFHEAFGDYGTITRVTLPTNPDTGALKGFGYVGFTTVDEAKSAMDALEGSTIDGRTIRIDFTTPRGEGGDRGFRGGRGGDRGGRGGGFRGGRGGDRGGRGGRGDFRGGRGGRGDSRGGRGRGGFSTNRGGMGDFSGKKTTF